jgi:hypothetical protein
LAGFAEEVEGADEGTGAGGVEATEAFATWGVIEGEAIDFIGCVGLLALLVMGFELEESCRGAGDEVTEPCAGRGLFAGVEECLPAARRGW